MCFISSGTDALQTDADAALEAQSVIVEIHLVKNKKKAHAFQNFKTTGNILENLKIVFTSCFRHLSEEVCSLAF